MKLTLDALNTFIAIVESGSLSAAAERLNQPVSAVSRTLSKLEADLNLTLLQRSTRRMNLTEEGRLLLSHAKQILDNVQAAEEKLALRQQSVSGLLRINTSMPVMRHVLAPAIAIFGREYPQIEVELNSDDSLIDLIEERTDVAIRIGRLQDSSMHARLLGYSRIRILASTDYLARFGKPENINELAKHCLLGFTQPSSLNRWPLDNGRGQLLDINPTIQASSGETLLALALNHSGITCLSDLMTWQARQTGQLVEILPEKVQTVTQPIYAVYYRNRTLTARTALFIDFLANYVDSQDWCYRGGK